MAKRGRPAVKDARNKLLQIRLNSLENDELEDVVERLNTEKTALIKEAVREYLKHMDISIWTKN